MKICNICNTEKDFSEFTTKQNSKDKLTSYCKECQILKSTNYRLENPFKICTTCNTVKAISDFKKLNNSLSGVGNKCVECHKPGRYKHWNDNKEGINTKRRVENLSEEDKIKKRIQKVRQSKNDLRGPMLQRARTRAKKKGLEFNIIKEDIIIPEFCPLLGVKFETGYGKEYRYTPSLDRIDSSKGYIKGNIQVITYLANTMKNQATEIELIAFSKNIIKIYDIV